MIDLLLSLILIVALAIGAFVLSVRFCRSRSESVRNAVGLLVILLGGIYLRFAWDQTFLATLVPNSEMVVLGNWFPIFAAALAGVVWTGSGEFARRAIPVAMLGVVSVISIASPLSGEKPVCGESWRGGVCLQTTPYTCSPASAATLLRIHGIEATEREMAELCLTRIGTTQRGTNWMGLFRGLSKKVADSPWRVEVFDVSANAKETPPATPAILVARLPVDSQNHELRDTSGWLPGQAHSVVYLGNLTDDVLIVGDPTVGRELWRRDDLTTLWTGRGLRLVPRDNAATTSLVAARQ